MSIFDKAARVALQAELRALKQQGKLLRTAEKAKPEFVNVGASKNPAGKSKKQWEAEQQYKHDIEQLHEFSEPKQLSIEDLQGGVLAPIPGDRTITGYGIKAVNEVPLSEASVQYGGPSYGHKKADEGFADFWASNASAAKGAQNRIALAGESGKPVYGMYVSMAPESGQFALHNADALIKQLDAYNPSKKQVKAFDNLMREKFPEFVGLKDPELMSQLRKESEMRKYLVDRMERPTITEALDLPSGLATRHAITEPALRDTPTGLSGFSVGRMKPEEKLAYGQYYQHPTYDTKIPGEYMGQMEMQLPWEYFFPDVAKRIAESPKHAEHAFGTFKASKDAFQPVTQEMIDRIMTLNELYKAGNFKKGGTVKMADGGGYTDPMGGFYPSMDEMNYELSLKDAAKNIFKGLTDPRQLKETAEGIGRLRENAPRVAESVARGAIAQIPGTVGDIEQLGRMGLNYLNRKNFQQNKDLVGEDTFFPTTREILDYVPRISDTHEGAETVEDVGSIVAPGIGKLATEIKATPEIASALKNVPVGASVKPVDAIPTGAPKAEKILAPADELGFYSNVEKATLNLQRKSGNGNAFLNDILKQPGINKDELDWMGLPEFLKNQKNVTKDDIINFVNDNKIKLEETTLSTSGDQLANVLAKYDLKVKAYNDGLGNQDLIVFDKNGMEIPFDSLPDDAQRILNNQSKYVPKHEDHYRTPNGENYREILLRLPTIEADKLTELSGKEYDRLAKVMYGKKNFFDNLTFEQQDAIARRARIENEPFVEGHYPEHSNTMINLRVDDRVDVDGKKGLLIDELQSDWHQKGREFGYIGQGKTEYDRARMNLEKLEGDMAKYNAVEPPDSFWVLKDSQGNTLPERYGSFNEAEKAFDNLGGDYKVSKLVAITPERKKWLDDTHTLRQNLNYARSTLRRLKEAGKDVEGIPDAPYKNTYHELALKRMLREGAEKGYDRILLPTGNTLADRYNLAKQIDELIVTKGDDNTYTLYATMPGGEETKTIATNLPESSLSDYLGQSLSKNVSKQQAGTTDVYNADNLKVGGEGMKKYYDEVYPSFLKKFAKKYGGEVGVTEIPTAKTMYVITDQNGLLLSGEDFTTKGLATLRYERLIRDGVIPADAVITPIKKGPNNKVFYYEFSPEAKEKILKGLPMKKGGSVKMAKTLPEMKLELTKKAQGGITRTGETTLSRKPMQPQQRMASAQIQQPNLGAQQPVQAPAIPAPEPTPEPIVKPMPLPVDEPVIPQAPETPQLSTSPASTNPYTPDHPSYSNWNQQQEDNSWMADNPYPLNSVYRQAWFTQMANQRAQQKALQQAQASTNPLTPSTQSLTPTYDGLTSGLAMKDGGRVYMSNGGITETGLTEEEMRMLTGETVLPPVVVYAKKEVEKAPEPVVTKKEEPAPQRGGSFLDGVKNLVSSIGTGAKAVEDLPPVVSTAKREPEVKPSWDFTEMFKAYRKVLDELYPNNLDNEMRAYMYAQQSVKPKMMGVGGIAKIAKALKPASVAESNLAKAKEMLLKKQIQNQLSGADKQMDVYKRTNVMPETKPVTPEEVEAEYLRRMQDEESGQLPLEFKSGGKVKNQLSLDAMRLALTKR